MWAWFILLVLAVPSAWACQCISWPSAKDSWQTAPVVFRGHVERTDVEFDEFGAPSPGWEWQGEDQKVWVKVDEAFKGTRAGAQLLLEQPVDSCSPTFRSGDQRVFYLAPGRTSWSWRVQGCGRTRKVEDGANDLLFLRALPWAAKRSRLAGEVNLFENSMTTGTRRMRGLSGIPVRIRGAGRLIETATNADGVYEVYDLPEGSYSIELERPTGLAIRRAADDRVVTLSAGGGTEVSFVLMEDNVVAGRVVDPSGNPMAGVPITLEPAEGDAESADLPDVYTKPDGTFKLEEVPSGEFVLVANQPGDISGRTPFDTVYLPGTVQRKQAQVLRISAGQHFENLVLTVPKVEPTITVSGIVQFNDGKPAAEARLYSLDGDDMDSLRVSTDSAGFFQVPLLDGQSARIQALWTIFRRNLRQECPELTRTGGNPYSAELQSEPVPIPADASQTGLILTLPAPSCKAP